VLKPDRSTSTYCKETREDRSQQWRCLSNSTQIIIIYHMNVCCPRKTDKVFFLRPTPKERAEKLLPISSHNLHASSPTCYSIPYLYTINASAMRYQRVFCQRTPMSQHILHRSWTDHASFCDRSCEGIGVAVVATNTAVSATAEATTTAAESTTSTAAREATSRATEATS
jgi:hypothetical protein